MMNGIWCIKKIKIKINCLNFHVRLKVPISLSPSHSGLPNTNEGRLIPRIFILSKNLNAMILTLDSPKSEGSAEMLQLQMNLG